MLRLKGTMIHWMSMINQINGIEFGKRKPLLVKSSSYCILTLL